MDLENFILHDLYVCLSASYFRSCFFYPALDLTLQDPQLLLYKLLLLMTFSSFPSLYFSFKSLSKKIYGSDGNFVPHNHSRTQLLLSTYSTGFPWNPLHLDDR